MARISLTSNAADVGKFLTSIARDQIPFASALALTRTAQDIQKVMPQGLERALDKPTPFTLRGTYIQPARKDRLESAVGFKDRQADYLKYQVFGGRRQPGKIALRLPGDVQLDAYGNLPRDTIKKLIAAAKSGQYGGTVRRRLGVGGRRKAKGDLSLFYGQPAHLNPGWPVGIYRRVRGTGGGPGKLIPIILFPKKHAQYRARFDFFGLAGRTFAANYQRNFESALQKAIATRRPR